MLHDCYVETDSPLAEVRMPSIVAELHKARKERLERIKLAAFTMVEVAPEIVPAPAPVTDSWVERQRRIRLPKPRWFSVVEDLGPVEPRAPMIEDIIHACSQYFDIAKPDLISNRRHAPSVYARHIVMYLAKTLTQRSFPDIGRRLGKRDHTTILHGVRKISKRMQSDWTIAYDVAHVEAML